MVPKSVTTPNFILVSTFLSGLLVRLLNLGAKSLWLDEAFALYVAQESAVDILLKGGDPVHPPLFFLILHFWAELSLTESMLRLLPVLFSVIAIFPIYQIAKELFDRHVALTTVLLYTFNPLIIWYAQELRMYALFLLMGAGSTAALLLGSRSNLKTSSFLYFCIAVFFTVGLAYTHYAAFLFSYFQLLLIIVLIAYGKRSLQALFLWIGATLVSVVFYLPWALSPNAQVFYSKLFSGRGVGYYAPFLSYFVDGSTDAGQLIITLIRVGMGLFAPFIVYAIISRTQVRKSISKLIEMNWIRPIVAIGFCLFLILSVFPRGYTIKRHLLIYIPFALIFFGWYWPFISQKNRTVGYLVLFSLIASFINIYTIPKTEWREINQQIVSVDLNENSTNVVILNPGYLDVPFDYYNNKRDMIFDGSAEELNELIASSDGSQHIWYIEQEINPDYRVELANTLFSQYDVVDTPQYTNTRVYQLNK